MNRYLLLKARSRSLEICLEQGDSSRTQLSTNQTSQSLKKWKSISCHYFKTHLGKWSCTIFPAIRWPGSFLNEKLFQKKLSGLSLNYLKAIFGAASFIMFIQVHIAQRKETLDSLSRSFLYSTCKKSLMLLYRLESVKSIINSISHAMNGKYIILRLFATQTSTSHKFLRLKRRNFDTSAVRHRAPCSCWMIWDIFF